MKFKKILLYATVGMWILLGGVKVMAKSDIKAAGIGEAYLTVVKKRMVPESFFGSVELRGKSPNYNLSQEEKDRLVLDIGNLLGEWGEASTVSCNSVGEEYVTTYFRVYSSELSDYEKTLEGEKLYRRIIEAAGLEGEVYVNLGASLFGELSILKRDDITQEIFQSLNAYYVTGIRESELYTVYGYTDRLKECINVGEAKINVNVSFSYDSENDLTVIILSSPINSLDF